MKQTLRDFYQKEWDNCTAKIHLQATNELYEYLSSLISHMNIDVPVPGVPAC